MLRPVEHEHVARDGLGRDQVRILRHVARAVDLARVVDPLHDADARLRRGERVPAELAALLVVRATIEDIRARSVAGRDLHRRDLEVVGRLAGRVRAEKQAVDRVGLVGGTELGEGGGISPRRERAGARRTILCLGTTGRSGSASQAHELS